MTEKHFDIVFCFTFIVFLLILCAILNDAVRAKMSCWSEVPKRFTDLVEFYEPYLRDQKTASPRQLTRMAKKLKRETTEVLDQINPDEAPQEIWRCEAAMFEMAEAFMVLSQENQSPLEARLLPMQQEITSHLTACLDALQEWCAN